MAAEAVRNGVGECPDLETIAAYLDGRVVDHERARIAEHLATCETCYFVLSEAAHIHVTASEQRPAPAWWKNPRIVWPSAAAVLATAAALVLAVNLSFFNRTVDGPELQALVAAVGTNRTIEPRLTGGFAHGPLRGAIRSGGASPATLSPDVRIAVAQIEKEATSQSPRELRLRGIASLMLGDTDRAVASLEAAAAGQPDDARILNDLAAAYLVRAHRNNQPDDLATALASVNRALNADRSLPEVWFNRAYALERLALTDEAREAWQAYLTIDDRSGWADEARAHLRTLTTQP